MYLINLEMCLSVDLVGARTACLYAPTYISRDILHSFINYILMKVQYERVKAGTLSACSPTKSCSQSQHQKLGSVEYSKCSTAADSNLEGHLTIKTITVLFSSLMFFKGT